MLESPDPPDCLASLGGGLAGWQPYPGTACADWMNCSDAQNKAAPEVHAVMPLAVVQMPLFGELAA